MDSAIAQLIPFALIILVFVIFVVLPNSKRAKDRNAMLASLKAGDKVMTTGGIFGEIVSVKGKIVTLRINPDVSIKVLLDSVQGLSDPNKMDVKA